MKKIRNVIAFLVAAVALVFTGGHALADDTGSITIQNAQLGQTYTLYKLFDATVGANNAIAYTLPSGKSAADVADYFNVDSAGNVTAKSTTTETVVRSDAFKTWAKTFGTQVGSSVEATGNTVAFSGLSFGYYFVESSLGAAITVDSTTPAAYVVDKNADGPNTAVKTSSVSTAKIGDTVNYTVKYNATNYVMLSGNGRQITSYTITDTPTNLAIDASTVEVKVKSTVTGTEQTVTPQSATVDSNGKLTVVLPWVNTSTGASLYDTPSEVTLTYSATVTAGAIATDSLKGDATNKAVIRYDYGSNHDQIETETVTVNTLGFGIRKTDSVAGTLLQGAEFKIYTSATGGTPVKFVKVGDSKYYRLATADDTNTVEVIPAGDPYLVGLNDGDEFYIEEVKAPAGYNKLTQREYVKINGEGTTAIIKNSKGTELPSTGSFGTRMIYVVGAAAILVASVYMVAKRRVKNL